MANINFVVKNDIELKGNLIFEGSADNEFETTLAITNPTADRTITFPDGSGTVALTSNLSSYQPLDTDLTAIAGLTSAADRLPYFTGSGTASLATFTSFGRSLLDDADAATARATMGLGSVENTALSTWAGSTSITTLGTITSGTWSGTAIGASKGGTGLTSYASGDILYASSSSALSKLSATTNGYILTLASGLPTWAEAPAGTTVSSTAPVGPVSGESWFDNTTGSYYVYDGSFWQEVNGVIENTITDEQVQDVIGPVFAHANHTNIVATYNDDNNRVDLALATDVVIAGNLTVNGTTTTINTNQLLVEDNLITLNSNVTGTPSTNAGIEVERGDLANVQIRFNETTDTWEFTNDGITYTGIGTGSGTGGGSNMISTNVALSNSFWLGA